MSCSCCSSNLKFLSQLLLKTSLNKQSGNRVLSVACSSLALLFNKIAEIIKLSLLVLDIMKNVVTGAIYLCEM